MYIYKHICKYLCNLCGVKGHKFNIMSLKVHHTVTVLSYITDNWHFNGDLRSIICNLYCLDIIDCETSDDRPVFSII